MKPFERTEVERADADALYASLRRMKIVSADIPIALRALSGGVSSDIYRADAAGSTFCVKRALPKLKVAADWQAPVSRNRAEVAWLRRAAQWAPGHAPAILADDPQGCAFAMEWLPPARYPTWKELLRDGHADVATAAAVGDLLGRIHSASADAAEVAAEFDNRDTFHAIRLEPYLVATAHAHPDLAAPLHALVASIQSHRRVLVHGDFSPKNILIGPGGPVMLDAECACFGDPAFDVAFVVNHLLLKGLWRPQWKARYVDLMHALVSAYSAHVRWESWRSLEARVAALLPALLLARADGKSPAEYLDDDAKRQVRTFARPRVANAPTDLACVGRDWCAT
ncbi:MAG: aminoglycoside phosphotransferase family protein [Casimicrobiaceae bacterium]